MEEYLRKKSNSLLSEVEILLKHMEKYKDEGWVLAFCDSLNKLSVTY